MLSKEQSLALANIRSPSSLHRVLRVSGMDFRWTWTLARVRSRGLVMTQVAHPEDMAAMHWTAVWLPRLLWLSPVAAAAGTTV